MHIPNSKNTQDHTVDAAACRESICMYHSQNMEIFKDLKDSIREIVVAVQNCDRDIVKINTASKVRIAIFGTIITITLFIGGGVSGVMWKEFADLRVTVYSGRDSRLEMKGDIKSLKEDVQEIKEHVGFYYGKAENTPGRKLK